MSEFTDRIKTDLAPIVSELGCSIVRVCFFKNPKRRTLQIMLERLDGSSVNIDDCEKVSHAVSVCLDATNPIQGHYNLEVSSTGIDRPLVSKEDYQKFSGKPVVIKTYVLKDDRKIFKGTLDSATEDDIMLLLDLPLSDGSKTIRLSYSEIKSGCIDGFKAMEMQ